MLSPERVQIVPRLRRPPSSARCCSLKRSLFCLLPAFIMLQLVFVAYMSQEAGLLPERHAGGRPAARAELEPTAPVQPTLQPAAAAEPAESTAAEPLAGSEQSEAVGGGGEEAGGGGEEEEDGTDGTDGSPPGRAHGHGGGGRRRKKRLVVVRRPVNLTQEFVWDFSAVTVRGEQSRLLGCLGRGTYGIVLNASYSDAPDAPGHAAALKVPLLRTWGFRFYRIELQVLLALQQGGEGGEGGRGGASPADQEAQGGATEDEGERNLVRLLGNTTVAVSRLLELDGGEEQWSCLNHTDLLQWPKVTALPGMLLELLPRGSLFHALAALAAPEAVAQLAGLPPPPRLSLDAQRKVFKQRLQAARRPEAPFREAVEHPWDILLGLARGMRRMHARHAPRYLLTMLHLLGSTTTSTYSTYSTHSTHSTYPTHCTYQARAAPRSHRAWEERHDQAGCPWPHRHPRRLLAGRTVASSAVASSAIAGSAIASSASPPPSSLDSAQAERCSAGRGAGARAIETYAFGNVLYFACYGHVRRTVSWSKYSCDLPRPGLLELQLTHTKDQPTGPADTEARFNRCASVLQSQLDDLMRYCWQPTLEAAEALLRPAVAQHPSNRPANFSWEVVIGQLQAMHRIGTGRRPLFRFM